MQYRTPTPALRRLAFTSALLALAACDDASSPPPLPPEPAIGRYALEAVDEQPPPATLFEGDVEIPAGEFHMRIVVLEGELELLANRRYAQRVVVQAYFDGEPDIAGPEEWDDHGVFRPEGGALRFESGWIDGLTFVAVHRDGGLDVEQDLLRYFHDEGAVTRFRYEP